MEKIDIYFLLFTKFPLSLLSTSYSILKFISKKKAEDHVYKTLYHLVKAKLIGQIHQDLGEEIQFYSFIKSEDKTFYCVLLNIDFFFFWFKYI